MIESFTQMSQLTSKTVKFVTNLTHFVYKPAIPADWSVTTSSRTQNAHALECQIWAKSGPDWPQMGHAGTL